MDSLEELIGQVTRYHPEADVGLLRRAYEFGEHHHTGQKRKSGERYFTHPIAVSKIITELRLDSASLCAALLHDTVEDTKATLDDVQREFGEEVAFLVDGVTKLSKFNFTSKEDAQAENFRKMLLHMASDIRVLLVKARRSPSSSTASPSCRSSTSLPRKTPRRRTSARCCSTWRATSACSS